MGEDEVRLVREAFLKERRARILNELMSNDLIRIRAIDEKMARLQSDLEAAEKALFVSRKT
jgi:hypothetical protein